MAVPVQFGGPPVPIAWAAEAVALAWVAVLRRHPYSAGVSVLLATLALWHLVAIEYEPGGSGRRLQPVDPVRRAGGDDLRVHGRGAGRRGPRSSGSPGCAPGFAVVGGLVAIYVFPFELSGPALVAGWAILATAAFGLYARVVVRHIPGDFRERPRGGARPARTDRRAGRRGRVVAERGRRGRASSRPPSSPAPARSPTWPSSTTRRFRSTRERPTPSRLSACLASRSRSSSRRWSARGCSSRSPGCASG